MPLNGPVIRIETVLVGDLYRMTFCENLTALVNSNESSWKRGDRRRPLIDGLLFGSISRQLDIRSRINPSSFLRASTPALANVCRALSLVSCWVTRWPGNLGPWEPLLPGIPPLASYCSETDLKWNFLEFSYVKRLL